MIVKELVDVFTFYILVGGGGVDVLISFSGASQFNVYSLTGKALTKTIHSLAVAEGLVCVGGDKLV